LARDREGIEIAGTLLLIDVDRLYQVVAMSDTKKRRPNSFRASRNSLNSRPQTSMSLSAPNVSHSSRNVAVVTAATRSKTVSNLATTKVSVLYSMRVH